MIQRYDDFGGVPVDPVTSLFRLGAGGPSLTRALTAAAATGRKVALLHIGIDDFGRINASMGTDVGDQVLAAIAERLHKAMPAAGSWLWRVSGDQFVAGIGYRNGELDGEGLAERVRDALESPLSVPPYSVTVVPSIGMAVSPDHAHDSAALLACAEEAMQQGRRESRLVPPPRDIAVGRHMVEETGGGSALARSFLDAMENDEFQLFYQPVVGAGDGSIDSVNALLRWQSERHGLVRPNHFLQLVDSVGLSAQLGCWVVEHGVAQLAQWRAQGMDYINMALHLADAVLLQGDCVDRIARLLHRHDVPASALEFEISEQGLNSESRQLHDSLDGLRRLGAAITLQDFGMGGLNLATLAQAPLDRLKLDRSLLHNVLSDPRTVAMLRGMIEMGHRLGLQVTAKGVETEAELGLLRRHQCDFFQGYLFFPPLPADEVAEVIRKRFLLPQAFAPASVQRTLLLVDDEENVLRSLLRLFRRDGYRILTSSSVREAFDLLASERVQVIVSDQRMAGMNGTEFLTRVRDLYPDTIRMVLSGYTDLATITQAINRGAIYRFLTKPWNDDELREHIGDAFRAHEQRQADDTTYQA